MRVKTKLSIKMFWLRMSFISIGIYMHAYLNQALVENCANMAMNNANKSMLKSNLEICLINFGLV